MDAHIQRALNDKIYDKRKQGALELESVIRECLTTNDTKRIANIVNQLCHDYAYAWQLPHARNGGLIGLAAAAIALGSDNVAPYLKAIVPPVLACFTDQDARVRYYACESMYNIAKVAKGEILVFFNDVFDALCKLAADSELSVKNGAELLDRLIKDIVSESAATYVSSVAPEDEAKRNHDAGDSMDSSAYFPPTAFSLAKFIPLLKERIYVINPFTRNFLVAWVVLLDSIPDLELVTYLPDFLDGFLKFLSDSNHDVNVLTQRALDRFLNEIKRVDKLKRGIAERRRNKAERKARRKGTNDFDSPRVDSDAGDVSSQGGDVDYSGESSGDDDDGDWLPGQDTYIDYPRILEILVDALDPSSEGEIRLTSLQWIDAFFDICPEEILPFVPKLLSQVLPAMASTHDQVRQAASRVNASLMDYMSTLPDEDSPESHRPAPLSRLTTSTFKTADERARGASISTLPTISSDGDATSRHDADKADQQLDYPGSQVPTGANQSPKENADLDYRAAVGALTLHFLADHEATRVAALNWLILLHRKAPRKVLAMNDGTFPALLKTLSDPDESVVTKDLQLLAQISRNSDDSYFTSFIENVLQLFGTDRKLLEQRGNLIIRQLCGSLSPDRIYRTMADCLEREEDIDFATIMVQSLNNNLITAPQLAELRKRLRTLDNRDGQALFVTLFRSWCYNAVATFSLCLLAQAYEQAYQLLLIIGELETTVQMLIEIDKLVQLLESPVFTYLRLQLLEPERYPYLYKCLYGVLMLLPQSAAFAALKNRLGSVSAIGYLHTPGRPIGGSAILSAAASNLASSNSAASARIEAPRGNSSSTTSLPSQPGANSVGRHKSRDEGTAIVRWPELLDKFKTVQERARKARKGPLYIPDDDERAASDSLAASGILGRGGPGAVSIEEAVSKALPMQSLTSGGGNGTQAGSSTQANAGRDSGKATTAAAHKSRSSLGNMGRLVRGVAQKKKT